MDLVPIRLAVTVLGLVASRSTLVCPLILFLHADESVKSHDAEIDILASRLTGLEKQYIAAQAHTASLKTVSHFARIIIKKQNGGFGS